MWGSSQDEDARWEKWEMLANYVKANFNPTVQTKSEILLMVPFYFEVPNCEIIKMEEW